MYDKQFIISFTYMKLSELFELELSLCEFNLSLSLSLSLLGLLRFLVAFWLQFLGFWLMSPLSL